MSDRVRLSVVTVVLNDRDGFLRTAKSLVPQLAPEVEWVVIDGASTDGTLEEIKSNRAHISNLVSEPDRGIYDAMNKGASLCSGDYLVFMNAGDLFTEGAIAIALDHIEKSNGTDVLCGDWYVIGGGAEIRKTAQPDQITRYMSISHQATFVPLAAFRSFGGYSRKYTLAADYDLFVRMACNGVTFKTIGAPLVHYFRGGATDKRYPTSMSEAIRILWANKSPHRLAGTRFYVRAALRRLTGRT